MRLIIATPSPFARKARIALLEKAMPHECVIENPWQSGTAVPNTNPLGKVPTLILNDAGVIHDSKVIVEYLETLGAAPQLLPSEAMQRIAHKQIEAIADGICDAVVLILLERSRPAAMQSADWMERQRRKVVAGTSELARLLGEREWFTPHGFGLAEIATGCALGYLDLRFPEYDWRAAAPNLRALAERLATRPSFAKTVPSAQVIPTTA